ncbi:hypothetical protein SAMN06295888_14610 [Desulfonatronum zhilinae]|nr:hypothetical protein SAMN06295888_14610 [Desulfonatronum zhilinae]
MTEIRLKADNPDKAVEIVVEALAFEEARLQYSLALAKKRLRFFEGKYGVDSERFMGGWTAEDLEGRDMEYVEWAGEYKFATSLMNRIDVITGIRHDPS